MRGIYTKAILLLSFIVITTGSAMADLPPDPGSGGPGGGDLPVGGGSPIGAGLVIMTVLGSIYGVKKYLKSRKEE
jgi:hypothetical protein